MANESVAPEVSVTEEQHERADHRLAMAQGILGMIMEGGLRADPKEVSNAAWGAQTLIEEARNLYGKY